MMQNTKWPSPRIPRNRLLFLLSDDKTLLPENDIPSPLHLRLCSSTRECRSLGQITESNNPSHRIPDSRTLIHPIREWNCSSVWLISVVLCRVSGKVSQIPLLFHCFACLLNHSAYRIGRMRSLTAHVNIANKDNTLKYVVNIIITYFDHWKNQKKINVYKVHDYSTHHYTLFSDRGNRRIIEMMPIAGLLILRVRRI